MILWKWQLHVRANKLMMMMMITGHHPMRYRVTDFPTSSVFCLDVGFPTCSDWNYMSGSRRVDTRFLKSNFASGSSGYFPASLSWPSLHLSRKLKIQKRNPLKFAGVPQTNERISADSRPKSVSYTHLTLPTILRV